MPPAQYLDEGRSRSPTTAIAPGRPQPADLAELLGYGPDVVVLGRGRELRLEATRDTLSLLAARDVEVVRDETGAAIGEYDRLAAAGRRVAALLHSTC